MPKIAAFTRLFENKKESQFGSQNLVEHITGSSDNNFI